MRALAPLPAFLLLAASAAAASNALPEGKCTGQGKPPVSAIVLPAGEAYDLRARPIAPEERPNWESLGYRFNDDAGRILNPAGTVVTQAEVDGLRKPIDVSYEQLNASLWMELLRTGYRLDEATCHLIAPDGKPLDGFTRKLMDAMDRRGQSHAALESLLAKLLSLDPKATVPANIRWELLAPEKASTILSPKITELLKLNRTTVGDLRRLAAASYAESTKFYDGQRPFADTMRAAILTGAEPGVSARRKDIPDPNERVLGRELSAAFNAELQKTAPGRELLSHFHGPNGSDMPDVLVLKLTQLPDDPHAPGAVYDTGSDRMIINHWQIVRILRARLPLDKYAAIKDRVSDAKQLSNLLEADPLILPIIVDDTDVIYFHELTHAAQSRRNRIDDERLQANLPGAVPLSMEHEAHSAHCRYLLSKGPAAVERSDWRDYCLDLIRDPNAFNDRVTGQYRSTYSGFSTLEEVKAHQAVRREAANTLATTGSIANWITQTLKRDGFHLGDREFARYREDVGKREKDFLGDMPHLRRETAGIFLDYYEKTGAVHRALALALRLPPDSIAVDSARLKALTDKTLAWVTHSKDPAERNDRLAAINTLAPRLGEWPAALFDAYQHDGHSMAEEILAEALKATPDRRQYLLDQAKGWLATLNDPGDLRARIERARRRPK